MGNDLLGREKHDGVRRNCDRRPAEVSTPVSFACPSCGTDYSRKLARLQALPPRVRCHRCGTVWDPGAPVATAVPAADPPVAPKPQEAPATGDEVPPPARVKRRLRLAPVLWTLAALLVIGAAGGFGYAFRDRLPFMAEPLPVLADVQPVWTEVDGRMHLDVTARVLNPAGAPTTVDRVRVKFISPRGAWVGEVMVSLPPTAVAGSGEAPVRFTVERVPDGTASLEFVVVPVGHGAS
jgi:predicted Zn finger-like uncharacterized protein